MGSFSFGSGNGAQLLRLPLHLGGAIVTRVVPRSANLWVFGCAIGIGEGALALWQQADAAGERSVWLVANDREAADASARGIRWARKRSLRGFWSTVRAGVVVVTHGAGDVNRYGTAGSFLVQLWHGIPLKRIGLDSAVTARAPIPVPGLAALLRFAYRRTQRRIRLIPAASHLVRGRLESAFGLSDDRVPVTGEPRVDVLSAGDAAHRRQTAREAISGVTGAHLGDGTRLVLYAPTWRDGEPDPGVPTPAEWRGIVTVLERADALLLIRSHPLGAGSYAPPADTDRVRSLGSDLVAEVTPLLPGVDVLITDYSSLAYDSALVPLPVIYFAPDEAAYADSRGFYGRYRDVAGDDVASDWTAAANQLERLLADPFENQRRLDRAGSLSLAVHRHRDGRNAERVYQAIRRVREGLDA
ncbi:MULTISPECIES: CDP-glycerol glycerophosphotransferase family protein [unclassified Microbacterium]|uniref:CDP-glycerol glycerophosphotransferase family protein n=1 Tax=unclassified Microbacterium TaxID=2609290 RepID=UPI00386FCEBE